jgi:anti-anti-sigma factor
MQYVSNQTAQGMEVSFSGRLIFADNGAFREIVQSLDGRNSGELLFDLENLDFVDSAGLGMFLIAKEAAESKGMKLRVRGAKGQVAEMLEVSQFSNVINIEN